MSRPWAAYTGSPPAPASIGPGTCVTHYHKGYKDGQASRQAEVDQTENRALRAQAHADALTHRIVGALHYIRNTYKTLGTAGQPAILDLLGELTDLLAPTGLDAPYLWDEQAALAARPTRD